MTNKILVRSMIVWLGIIPMAFINGGLREYVLIPLIGQIALPLSGVILCAMVFFLSYIFVPRLGKGTQGTYIIIGLIWIVSTILFEFLLGFLIGETFANMLNSYNVFTGNLWLIVVLFIGFSPWLAAKRNKMI